jgi:putative methionine-R-sulfoxide reductase with GAF domain
MSGPERESRSVVGRADIVSDPTPMEPDRLTGSADLLAAGSADLSADGLAESLGWLAMLAGSALSTPRASVMFAGTYLLPPHGAARIDGRLSSFEQGLCTDVVRSRDKLIIGDVRVDSRVSGNSRPDPASMLAWAGVPVHDQDDHVTGVLWVADQVARQWSASDVTVLETLARLVWSEVSLRAALAHSAGRAALAGTLEESLLPPRLPQIPGLQVAARYAAGGTGAAHYSAGGTGAEGYAAGGTGAGGYAAGGTGAAHYSAGGTGAAGYAAGGTGAAGYAAGGTGAEGYAAGGTGAEVLGDFCDVFPAANQTWGIVVGDVCGKGPAAAKRTALARYALRAVARRQTRPSLLLAGLNQVLLDWPTDDPRFLTAIYAAVRLVPGGTMVRISSAGHPLALVRTANGRVHEFGRPGDLLGVLAQPELHDSQRLLRSGDSLILFSDGVTEARRGADRELYGDERLRRLVAGLDDLTAVAMAEAIQRATLSFGDGRRSDDTVALVMKVPHA